MSHHFISSTGETGHDFIHDEGLCTDGDTFPRSVCDVSKTCSNRTPHSMTILLFKNSNLHDS